MGLVGAALAWVVRVLIDLMLLHVAVNRFIRGTNEKSKY
jgi:hypothetical protein